MLIFLEAKAQSYHLVYYGICFVEKPHPSNRPIWNYVFFIQLPYLFLKSAYRRRGRIYRTANAQEYYQERQRNKTLLTYFNDIHQPKAFTELIIMSFVTDTDDFYEILMYLLLLTFFTCFCSYDLKKIT